MSNSMKSEILMSVGGESRPFRLNTEPSPALVRFFEDHRDELLQREGEDDDRYGVRLYHFFTATPERLHSCVRMSLSGDHTGIDWYYDGNIAEEIRALTTYFGVAIPKAQAMLADLPGAQKPE